MGRDRAGPRAAGRGEAVNDPTGATGERAARAAVGWPADLVFCDLFMPERDGLEVIRDLRRQAPGLPVVAMSGGGPDGATDLLPVARQFGAAGVLYKPLDRVVAVAALDRALGRPPAGCPAPAAVA